ncbi:hypothetical protein N9N28_14255 [Rubripirellula amarantea]|nr:hypothetical protein [Rubripirellula amarantea]
MLPIADNSDQWIEFIGGPFDGYRQQYLSTKKPLAPDVVWLVTNASLRQRGHGDCIKPTVENSLTSVALYALDDGSPLANYRYAGTIGPRAFTNVMAELKRPA